MNNAQLQDQIAPGGVGLALSTIWMTYGAWANFVPPDLSDVEYAALTAAFGAVFMALVNIIRYFTRKTREIKSPLARSMEDKGESEL